MTNETEALREEREEHVTIRRSPRYGVFMGLGAVLGALIGWAVSFFTEPGLAPDGTRVDTTPVIGLMVVVGFTVGAALGGLVAVLLDVTIGRKRTEAVATHTVVRAPEEELPGEPAAADAAEPDTDATEETPRHG